MGQFELGSGKLLPKDVPDPLDTAKEHPDGTIYRSDNGERFRLHARWVRVHARKDVPKPS